MRRRLGDWIVHWIFEAYRPSSRALGLYRIFYAAAVLVFMLPNFVRGVGHLPQSLYDPPLGPMRLVAALPPAWVLHGLGIGVAFSLVAVLVGWRTVGASWALSLLWMAGAGFRFSFGKIGHVLVPVILPPLLAAAGWGAALSFDARAGRRTPVRGWPIALFAWLLALMMLSAALPKIETGWLLPSSQVIQGVLYQQFVVHGRQELLASAALALESRPVWKSLEIATVVLEAGFVLAVLSPRTMRLACAAAAMFHLGVFLTLNIPFVGNVIAYAVFFFLLVRERSPGREPSHRPLPAWAPAAALATAGAAAFAHNSIGPPAYAAASLVTGRSGTWVPLLWLGAAGLVAGLYLAWSGVAIVHRRAR